MCKTDVLRRFFNLMFLFVLKFCGTLASNRVGGRYFGLSDWGSNVLFSRFTGGCGGIFILISDRKGL